MDNRSAQPAPHLSSASDISATKQALRERFRTARLALGEDEYRKAGEAICRRILTLPEIANASTLSIYWPILVKKEVDTRPLIEHLTELGKRVVLPVIVDSESAPEMGHVLFSRVDNLQPNRWGILEPAGDPVRAEEIDVVVVPALGAGRNLHRIGYGHGYYDAFLRRHPTKTVCAVFDTCLVDQLPHESHDVRLDAVVTESETVRDTS